VSPLAAAGSESAALPRSGVSSSGSGASPGVVAPVVPNRPSTRLQHGIPRPKVYMDGTVKYGLFVR
jgi:hypothetical protein